MTKTHIRRPTLPTSETNWDRSASIDWQRTLVVQDTVHIADVIIMGKLGNGGVSFRLSVNLGFGQYSE